MNATHRRIILSCLALGFSACNMQTYTLATCSFAGSSGTCTPNAIPGDPRNTFDTSIGLANPNNSSQTCVGNLHVSVNAPDNGYLAWSATEQDASTCAQFGPEQSDRKLLQPGNNDFDVYFPHNDFTFRVSVRPSSN